MKKLIYTVDQIMELVGYLETITVNGTENCKRVALISQIINSPTDAIEEEEGETNERNKHKSNRNKSIPEHE